MTDVAGLTRRYRETVAVAELVRGFAAVPYYTWAHRGQGEMAVWLPRRVRLDFRVP